MARGIRGAGAVAATALLVSALPAPATDAGAARALRAAKRRWADGIARLATRLPEPPGLSEWADAFAESSAHDAALLVPAGDLDRDGATDFVDVRMHADYDEQTETTTQTVRLEARRGRDGALLWTAAAPGAYVVPTTVGADGGPGLLSIGTTSPAEDGPLAAVPALHEQGTTTLAAFDARGTRLWQTAVPGVPRSGPPPQAPFSATYTDLGGLADVIAGGGRDVVLVTTTESEQRGPSPQRVDTTAQLGVVDGATGTYRTFGGALRGETPNVWVTPAGDLDGDRTADVTLSIVSGGRRVLHAFGTNGAELWSTTAVPHGHVWTAVALPDVTGDGRPDVGVGVADYGDRLLLDGESSAPDGGDETVTRAALVDGRTGTVRWVRPGWRVYALGDVDGHRGSEVAVANDIVERGAPITAAAYTASGKALWHVAVPGRLRGGDPDEAMASWPKQANDSSADGVPDLAWTVWDTGSSQWRAASGVVDGRSGRTRTDPLRTQHLAAALDGRGTDGVSVVGDVSTMAYAVTLTAWRGDRAARLWVARFSGRDLDPLLPFAVRADRDRCADLVVGAYWGGAVVVLSGATGRPLWGLRRTDDGPAQRTTKLPHGLRTTTYARSCG